MIGRVHLIDTDAAWRTVTEALRSAPRLAVDIEGDGFHRYPEHIALVQLGMPDGAQLLIDPLSIASLDPLADVLAEPQVQKVMHSADFDIRSLDRDYGYRVRGLFDTAIAAQFLGSERTGLSPVLADYAGIPLDKPVQLQRLDWSQRPLPEAALAYAAGDVAHLFALADALSERLRRLGRKEWAREECERLELVRYAPPPPPEEAYLGLKGARALSGRQLAVLREIYVYRESEARRLGRPPYRVMSDQFLLALARDGQPPTAGRRRAPSVVSSSGLLAALERGRRAEAVRLPVKRPPRVWTHDARERLSDLKEWRRAEAERLGIGAGLAWPAAHLERIALRPEAPLAELDDRDPPMVRRWQWRELGPSLERARGMLDGRIGPPGGAAR